MRIILFILLLSFYAPNSFAQNFGGGDQPIEISADTDLQWLQSKKQYVANGNVEVTQGNGKIFGDKIIADYRENAQTGKTEIWQLTAIDNVRLESDGNTASGQKAVYNLDDGAAILTGDNLNLTTPEQTITAQESLRYSMNTGTAEAIGNALIKQDNDHIKAETITANFSKDTQGKQTLETANASGNASIQYGTDNLKANNITASFSKDAQGKQSLKTAEANGSVTIKTVEEEITGQNATYNATQNTAEMRGNVVITRGPNKLEGDRAQINLKTSISKIFGNPKQNKRVKGVFFPSSRKTDQNKIEGAQ